MNNEDLDALVTRLKELEDPQKNAVPSLADTDWRTLSGVVVREIESLRQQLADSQKQVVILRDALAVVVDKPKSYEAVRVATQALASRR